MNLETAPGGAQGRTSQLQMDHAATAPIEFSDPVSQVDEPHAKSAARPVDWQDEADEVLFEQTVCGNQEALAALFRRHAARIRRIGWRILRDASESDDLVQDVFLYVFRKGRLYDPAKGPARSWLIQVAYTQALLRRRERSSHGLYARAVIERPSKTDPVVVQEVHQAHSVEWIFGRSGWKQTWDSLTEYQRETLRLHFYEGCTFTEIAEKLGQSYANIRHHYYRGLDRLRKHADDNDLRWP